MKIKLETALNSLGALNELSATSQLPAKIAYSVGRTFNSVMNHQKAFEKARIEKARNLAEKDEKGNPIIEEQEDAQTKRKVQTFKMTDESKKKLQEEVAELQEKEVDVWGRQISLAELGNINLRPAICSQLEWLIVEIIKPTLETAND